MPASERGLLIAAILWIALIALISVLGTDEAIVAFAEGDDALAQTIRARTHFRAVIQVALGFALIALSLGIVLRTLNPLEVSVSVSLGCVCIAANSYSTRRLAIIRSARRFGPWNAVRLVPSFVVGGGMFALAITGTLTVPSGLVALTAGYVAAAIASRAVRIPASQGAISGTEDVTRYGMQVVLAGLPALANQRLDQWVISLWLPAAELSVYATAVSLAVPITLIGVTAEMYLFPVLSAEGATLRDATYRRWLGRVLVSTSLSAVLLALLADPLLTGVFGPEYAASVVAGRILLIGGVALAGLSVATAHLKAQRQVQKVMKAQLIGLLLTVLLLPIGLTMMGIVGAAITSTIAYLAAFTYALVAARQLRDQLGIPLGACKLSCPATPSRNRRELSQPLGGNSSNFDRGRATR